MIIAVLGILVALSPLILSRWRTGVILFIVWVAFEDLLRKFLGNDLAVYGMKDGILLLTYWGCALRSHPLSARRHLPNLTVGLWALWILAECFNPRIAHPLVALVGLRMWLFYIPCFVLGFQFVEEPRQLVRLVVLAITLGAVVSLIGLLQVVFGLEWFNPSEEPADLRLMFFRLVPGESTVLMRPNSVFVDAGRFSQYLFNSLTLLTGLLVSRLDRSFHQPLPGAWLWGCLILIFSAFLTCGHRLIAAMLLVVLVWVVFARARALVGRRPGMKRLVIPIFRLFLIGGLSWWGVHQLASRQVRSVSEFYAKTLLPQGEQFEPLRRTEGLWKDIVRAAKQRDVMGHGTGTASLGLQYVYRVADLPITAALHQTEGGFAALVWEFGLIGVLLWIVWGARWMQLLMRDLGRARQSPYYGFILCILCYVALKLFGEFYYHVSAYQDFIPAFFLWFFGGVAAKLSELARLSPQEGAAR